MFANKKVLYSVLALIAVLLVAGSFWFGRNKGSKAEASPSPSVSPSPSPSGSPEIGAVSSSRPSPIPTPTPSPSPSPSPTPVTFSVTGLTAAVAPTSFSGACPKEFDFSANITTNAAGTVAYKWVRSDGGEGSVKSLTFSGAGTQAAENSSWTFGGAGNTYSNYWEKVQIVTPNSTASNQATFTLTCT